MGEGTLDPSHVTSPPHGEGSKRTEKEYGRRYVPPVLFFGFQLEDALLLQEEVAAFQHTSGDGLDRR